MVERLLGRADVLRAVAAGRRRGGAGPGLRAGRRAQPAPGLLLGHRLRHRGPAEGPARLRPADAGLRRHHVDQRPSRAAARARAGLDGGHGHRHVGGDGHPRRPARARPHRPRRRGHHRALRHRARLVGLPDEPLPRHRRGPAAAGLGHRDDRALRGVPGRGRLGHDRGRLRRALREGHRRARGARAGPRSALRGQPAARRAPRGAAGGPRPGHADHDRGRAAGDASSARACRRRACPPWTRSPPSRRPRRAACSRR